MRILLALLLALVGITAQAITIEVSTVGDANNAATNGNGAVDFEFGLMTHEFTNAQYAEFLNSIAATDTHSLYNTAMGSNARGGITRSGTSGSYTYAVKANMGNKPVNYVSFWDIARVANWLENGATSSSDTETGSYTLLGATSGAVVPVNPSSTFYLPSKDQWFKAAYYKGGGTNAGYWTFPVQSDSLTAIAAAGATGDGPGNTGETANLSNAAVWNGLTGNVTTVGTNGGPAAYGHYDMAGNVEEYNGNDNTGGGTTLGLRGGGYDGTTFGASKSINGASPFATTEVAQFGFRLVGVNVNPVPEPSTWALALSGLGLFMARRFRRVQHS